METQDFVAIDFETMTPELTSACAIGLVRVHSGGYQPEVLLTYQTDTRLQG